MKKLVLAVGLAVFSMTGAAQAGWFDNFQIRHLEREISKLEQTLSSLDDNMTFSRGSDINRIINQRLDIQAQLRRAKTRLARLKSAQVPQETVQKPSIQVTTPSVAGNTVTPPPVEIKPTNLADALKQIGVQGGTLGVAGGTVAAAVGAVVIGQAIRGQGGDGNSGSSNSTATSSTGSTN